MTAGQLADAVAVVTGGASGIGRAIVHRFAEEGASVVIADVDVEAGTAVQDDVVDGGGEAAFVQTDIASSSDVEALFDEVEERYTAPTVLINNAGAVFDDGNIDELTEEAWERNIDVNLKGHFLCTKRALPGMVENRDGRIVNMSSVNGLIGLGLTSYSAAKGGLLQLTKLVATQYGRYGVRANAICPGEILTPINTYTTAEPALRNEWLDQIPAGRFGEPEEVASVALFLASDESSYVNGEHITVDGGTLAGRNQRLQEVTYDVDKFE